MLEGKVARGEPGGQWWPSTKVLQENHRPTSCPQGLQVCYPASQKLSPLYRGRRSKGFHSSYPPNTCAQDMNLAEVSWDPVRWSSLGLGVGLELLRLCAPPQAAHPAALCHPPVLLFYPCLLPLSRSLSTTSEDLLLPLKLLLTLERFLLFSGPRPGKAEMHPRLHALLGRESLESEQMGSPSGVHVGALLGGNQAPPALTRCHPTFSPPSESLNFAHLS